MINATMVADSISPQNQRLTTMLITLPRFILAELNTHRMLSKNSASSRAIPFKKMVESVQNNPFIPIAWQKDHKGMQGNEYFTSGVNDLIDNHLRARDAAIERATEANQRGLTKQLCNRYLEPFMWHTVLISGTEWENFFALRCPQYEFKNQIGEVISTYRSKKDWLKEYSKYFKNEIVIPKNEIEWLKMNEGQAEIHMMALAEAMWDAYNESIPNKLEAGEWHIPFRDKINVSGYVNSNVHEKFNNGKGLLANIKATEIKVSIAMAARTSYTVVGEEKEVSYETLIGIHDKMCSAVPFHASPFEHCARAMSDSEFWYWRKQHGKGLQGVSEDAKTHINNGWSRNYRGFIQYREILENK